MKRTSKNKAQARGGGRRSKSGTRRLSWAWVFLGGGGILVFSVVSLSLFAPHLLGLGQRTQKASFANAPDVVLATATGEFRLSEHQGEVVLLYFSFPGWPTCALEAPALGRLQEEYQSRDVEVVAVNIEPSFALKEWQAWWRGYTDLPVTWAQDVQGQAAQAFQLTALGTKVIIDKQGRIVHRSIGLTGYEVLRAAIEAAL